MLKLKNKGKIIEQISRSYTKAAALSILIDSTHKPYKERTKSWQRWSTVHSGGWKKRLLLLYIYIHIRTAYGKNVLLCHPALYNKRSCSLLCVFATQQSQYFSTHIHLLSYIRLYVHTPLAFFPSSVALRIVVINSPSFQLPFKVGELEVFAAAAPTK